MLIYIFIRLSRAVVAPPLAHNIDFDFIDAIQVPYYYVDYVMAENMYSNHYYYMELKVALTAGQLWQCVIYTLTPQHACAARVTAIGSVCLCVQHLTSGASVRPENAVTYSVGNEESRMHAQYGIYHVVD